MIGKDEGLIIDPWKWGSYRINQQRRQPVPEQGPGDLERAWARGDQQVYATDPRGDGRSPSSS